MQSYLIAVPYTWIYVHLSKENTDNTSYIFHVFTDTELMDLKIRYKRYISK